MQRRLVTSILNTFAPGRSYSSKAGVEFASKHLHPSIPKILSSPIKSGKGSYIELEDGKKLLDFTCGIGVTNTGHCHPKVVAAAQKQLETIIHSQVFVGYCRPMIDLMEELLPIMPGSSLDSFFFVNSGSEAVENAVKLAKVATGRDEIIVMNGSFHGRTYATASLTNSKYVYREGCRPGMGGIHVTEFPYCFHCPNKSSSGCCGYSIDHLKALFKQRCPPSQVAAIMLEPILGEGGYVVPPASFLKELREICNKEGILLIADEVQTGFGRTGKWFAVEHFGVEPDILIIAKGIASGMPLSGIVASRKLMEKQAIGSVGGTYGGNAVSCAAGVGTIQAMKEEKMVENAAERGKQLFEGLQVLKNLSTPVDVRGLGLMVGVEFTVPGSASKIQSKCINDGVLLLTAGAYDTIRIIPPLNVSAEDVDKFLNVFVSNVTSVIGK